ncbi:hypothetical protein DFH09DRAFT_1092027 [Mycena vulgaris]|nr:hypothetical protein DFH09DRAFT_1092027 [Mycena vulgaris]
MSGSGISEDGAPDPEREGETRRRKTGRQESRRYVWMSEMRKRGGTGSSEGGNVDRAMTAKRLVRTKEGTQEAFSHGDYIQGGFTGLWPAPGLQSGAQAKVVHRPTEETGI